MCVCCNKKKRKKREEVERRKHREVQVNKLALLKVEKAEKEQVRLQKIERLLTKGHLFYKHGRNNKAERRFVYVDPRLKQIAWRRVSKTNTTKNSKIFPVSDVSSFLFFHFFFISFIRHLFFSFFFFFFASSHLLCSFPFLSFPFFSSIGGTTGCWSGTWFARVGC